MYELPDDPEQLADLAHAALDKLAALRQDKLPKVRDMPGAVGVSAQRIGESTRGTMDRTSAPFTWPGGKSRWAKLINERIGKVGVYVEPFAGSAAVMLKRDPSPREIICDLDGLVANFWRAMRDAPAEVAYHAAWPTIHQDLTARHPWLIRWREQHSHLLTADPFYFDAQVAGWWAWGASNWIGGGWCAAGGAWDKRPAAQNGNGTGVGVQASRGVHEKRPRAAYGGGFGCQAQRTPTAQVPAVAPDAARRHTSGAACRRRGCRSATAARYTTAPAGCPGSWILRPALSASSS